MKKTIDEIKDEVAVMYGYGSWHEVELNPRVHDDLIGRLHDIYNDEKVPKKRSGITIERVIITILSILVIYLLFRPVSNKEINTITKQIDSVKVNIDTITKRAVKQSGNNVKKANKIVNRVKNEKPVILDTSYAAKCKYISEY